MAAMGAFRLSIAGGEPLIEPDFFPLIEYAAKSGVDISFSTSGTVLTVDRARRLNDSNIKTVNVSIDGFDEESYGKVRGVGRFKYMLKGIDVLKKHYNGNVAAKCTITSTNCSKLIDIIKLAESLSLHSVKFNCVREAGRAATNGTNLLPTRNEYINAVKSVAEYIKGHSLNSIRVILPVNPFVDQSEQGDFMDDLGFGCYAGKESFCINPVGQITPCSSFGRDTYVDGSVRTTSLQEAWLNGKSISIFRSTNGSAECNSCSLYSGCRGGCYLRAFKSYGSIDEIDPYCYAHEPVVQEKILFMLKK